MGAKITTEIDPYIKQVFETMKNELGVTYKEILEEGILARIKDVDPVKAEEMEIIRLESQLSAHKMHLASLKVSTSQVKEKTSPRGDLHGIEAEREEWFLKKAPEISKAMKGPGVIWTTIAKRGPFVNAKQAKEWVFNHLPEWRKNHED